MIIEGPRESSTLLYPVSLWYLGVETGYRVGTPYRRRENINGAPEAKIDQFGPGFLQKVDFHMDVGNDFFSGLLFTFLASKFTIF